MLAQKPANAPEGPQVERVWQGFAAITVEKAIRRRMEQQAEQIIHASCVRVGRAGVLILGRSGAGKSTLALALMGMGARLVADDRTRLWREGAGLMAQAPASLHGLIEARGIGLLAAAATGAVAVGLVVDLDRREAERLPPQRRIDMLGVSLPLVLGPLHPGLAPGLRQMALAGRRA